MKALSFFFVGVVYAGLSVALGSMGAHALKATLTALGTQATWQIAHDYLAYHGLALMLIALADQRWPQLAALGACRWLAIGAGVFSAALFLFSLTANTLYAHAAPLGGGLMILGWLMLCWRVWKGAR